MRDADSYEKDIRRLYAYINDLESRCDRYERLLDMKDAQIDELRARLDAMVKDIADVVALQAPKPVIVECECPIEGHQPGCELDSLVKLAKKELGTYVEKPHGPVSDRLMQKFYGAKR